MLTVGMNKCSQLQNNNKIKETGESERASNQTKLDQTKPNQNQTKCKQNETKISPTLVTIALFWKIQQKGCVWVHVWLRLVLAKLILNGNKRPPNCGAIVILLHATLFLTIPHSACVYRLRNSFGRWFGSGESVHFVWIKWWKLLAESQSI